MLAPTDIALRPVGLKLGRPIDSEAALSEVLHAFFCTPELRTAAISFVSEMQAWFDTQTEFAFYASSLLFVYDAAAERSELRAKMIDFAHVHSPSEPCVAGPRKGLPLQDGPCDDSYREGLAHLRRLLDAW